MRGESLVLHWKLRHREYYLLHFGLWAIFTAVFFFSGIVITTYSRSASPELAFLADYVGFPMLALATLISIGIIKRYLSNKRKSMGQKNGEQK